MLLYQILLLQLDVSIQICIHLRLEGGMSSELNYLTKKMKLA